MFLTKKTSRFNFPRFAFQLKLFCVSFAHSVLAWLSIFLLFEPTTLRFCFHFFFHHMQSNVYVHLTNHFFVLRNCVQFRLCMQKWIIFFPLYRRYFCKSCIFSKLQRKNTKCFNIFFNLRIASGGGTCNTSYQQWHEFQKHTTIT